MRVRLNTSIYYDIGPQVNRSLKINLQARQTRWLLLGLHLTYSYVHAYVTRTKRHSLDRK